VYFSFVVAEVTHEDHGRIMGMNIQQLFKLGMKRDLPVLLEYQAYNGKIFDIGASGKAVTTDAIALGLPDWSFPRDKIPAEKATVKTIHCYHFLEHLSGENAILFLRECERVMIPGRSVLNFCMPYYNSNLQAECLDHKSSWNENSFRNLFNNSGYNIAGEWKLNTHFIMIAGVKEDNLCIIGQLVR
jgi:hypothetical protein